MKAVIEETLNVSILVFVDDFCNLEREYEDRMLYVSILVFVDDFCNVEEIEALNERIWVSILVFVDGFCNDTDAHFLELAVGKHMFQSLFL